MQEALSLEALQYHYQSLDKPQQAMRCAREALAIWKELANLSAQMRALTSIGSKHVENFEQDLALLAYEQADWLAGGDLRRAGLPCGATPSVRPSTASWALDCVLAGDSITTACARHFTTQSTASRDAVRAATGILPPQVLLTDRRPDIDLDAYTVFVDPCRLPRWR